MANRQTDLVLWHLRKLISLRTPEDLTDHHLLERFAAGHEEVAFAGLLERHGPMVWNVCRRVLYHSHDAEDAFQATFLVLIRKAGSLNQRGSLGNWLYTVAYRIALRARVDAARRRKHEGQAARLPITEPVSDLIRCDLRSVLDDELSHLPEKYRAPLVLCYLQGNTNVEVARQLGWTKGTVSGRLARGRELLKKRLIRRGLTLSTATLASVLEAQASVGTVPAGLAASTVQLAKVFSLGEGALAGKISGAVASLVKVTLQSMFLTKIKVAALLLAMGVFVSGAGLLARQTLAEKPSLPQHAEAPHQPAPAAARRTEETQAHADRYGDPLPEGAVARLGTVRLRQGGWDAGPLAYSADGATLISADEDGVVHFWEATTGKELRRLKVASWAAVHGAAISPDQELLAVVEPKSVSLWDLRTGKAFHPPSGPPPGDPFCVAFSPDGNTLAVGYRQAADGLWAVRKGGRNRPPTPGTLMARVLFSPDGKVLATKSAGANVIHLWDVATGKWLRHLPAAPFPAAFRSEFWLHDFCFSPDGASLAAAEGPGFHISLWDLATGKRLRRFEGHDDQVWGVAFSPDGTVLASADFRSVRFWHVATGKEARRAAAEFPANTGFLAFSPDGKTLASTGAGNTIRRWDVATAREYPLPPGHLARAHSLAFSPDGRALATAGDIDLDNAIRLWEAATGAPLRTLKGHEGTIDCLCPSADGKTLISADATGTVRVWDTATGAEVQRFGPARTDRGQPARVIAVSLSADGKTASAVTQGGPDYHEATLLIWDRLTGKVVREHKGLKGDPAWPRVWVFSSDGKLLAFRGDWSLHLVDVATGKEPFRLGDSGARPWSAAFSPDGKALAAAVEAPRAGQAGQAKPQSVVRVWELATGKAIVTLPCDGPSHLGHILAFSPDSRVLAVGQPDGSSIRLWELATGQEARRWPVQEGRVLSLAFAPAGKSLASGLMNGNVLVWDTIRPLERAAQSLSQDTLERLWQQLAGQDAAQGYRAICMLAAAPQQAVGWIKAHVHPAAEGGAQRVRQLIADLESKQFKARQAATAELEKLGATARPFLRQALAGKPSLEARQRLGALLDKPGLIRDAEELRGLRAVQVLEYLGTAEAREVLETLARGAPEARLTQEAKASVDRLTSK